MIKKTVLTVILMSLICPSASWAAFEFMKKESKPEPQKKEAALPASEQRETPKTENVETLFSTLNETLEENRKIKTGLKELQQSFQKKTIENEELKKELKKLEGLALERNRELSDRAKELEGKLKGSETSAQEFLKEKERFDQEKNQVRQESAIIQEENKKLKQTLASSVLEEEKASIIKIAKENGDAARKAGTSMVHLNAENQKMKNNLAAVQYEMGNVYFLLKRYSDSVKAYSRVLEYDPANAWAYHNMAVIEDYYLGDSQAAYAHYQQYLNYKPLDEEAQEIRRRVLDLNLLQKVSPDNPLKSDFDQVHKETRNPAI